MLEEIKLFSFKFALLLIFAPILGYVMLKFIENVEDAWKTNNRKKKWVVLSAIVAFIAGWVGWLR